MGMCAKCSKMCGFLVLVVGILLLLQNLGVWNFWGIQWYTLAFILVGLGGIGKSGCKDCMGGCCEVASEPAKPARKR